MDLEVHPERWKALKGQEVFPTGIYVRAKHENKWVNADIITLNAPSLLTWLRSRGGENSWAEGVVFTLLEYTPVEIEAAIQAVETGIKLHLAKGESDGE